MQRTTTAPLRALRALAPTRAPTQRRGLARMALVGRLGGDPELVPTASGKELIRYNLATNHGTGESRTTSWFPIAAFPESPKQKDYILGIQKGSIVHVEADSRMRTYDHPDGSRRTNLDLVQRNIEVITRYQGSQERTEQEAEQHAASA